MPAYNAAKTLEQTYNEIYRDFVDEVILVDDNSQDETREIAKKLGKGKKVVTVSPDGGDRYLSTELFNY